ADEDRRAARCRWCAAHGSLLELADGRTLIDGVAASQMKTAAPPAAGGAQPTAACWSWPTDAR
ncbi:hypothetical protein CKW48_21820, partial [Bordetella pertussis]